MDDVIERSGTRPGGQGEAAAIEKLTVNAIGTFPNTYTLTKATEHLLTREALRHGVPLLILRPSIVVLAGGSLCLAGLTGERRRPSSFPTAWGCWNSCPAMRAACRHCAWITVAHHTLLALRWMALEQAAVGGTGNWRASRVPPGDEGVPVMHCCTSTSSNPLPWRVVIKKVVGYWHRHPPQEYVSRPDGTFQMLRSHQNFQLQWWLRYTAPSSVYSTFANFVGSEKHVHKLRGQASDAACRARRHAV